MPYRRRSPRGTTWARQGRLSRPRGPHGKDPAPRAPGRARRGSVRPASSALDLGDLIGVEGVPFRTKRGELSLRVDDWTLLAKSLRPPPEKYHGLADVELRYRHRELDLIANPEARELFSCARRSWPPCAVSSTSADSWRSRRPVLQPLYGGALARPFTTHHNALDRTLYLRIATELYLKRLIVGGLEKVYELGKDFRNEGVSHKHNPEFTMLETLRGLCRLPRRRGDVRAAGRRRRPGGARSHDDRGRWEDDRSRAAMAPGHLARGDPRADRDRHPRVHGERRALIAAMRQARHSERPSPAPAGASSSTGSCRSTSSRT